MRTKNRLPALGAIFALALVFGLSREASAEHHRRPYPVAHCPPPPSPTCYRGHEQRCDSRGGFGFVFAPRPSGYYQTVTETVLVEPERVEQYWVPPAYSTVINACGQPQTVLVREGYMARRFIPARYEMVTRQVWVPYSRSRVSFGFSF